ncbi:hypothetical protein J1792_09315 [Streptomyces triculaminicus]|uniref:Oxidoreductase n=2 Tax=Streptomyces TaxID=1883 RepID=A0A939FLZ9_9ACTN|nr:MULTISPECIES: hypothetical protein [Streptomyces]MBO0652983.1 hypothetical protein [Streptomyces triculaminicus]QSY51474.1 hypothetical protein J3S04_11725 [Streptomyces griseocarneus]
MPPLTVEARLRARVAGGRKLDLEPRGHVTWADMRAWGYERTIAASALRKIILDGETVYPRGVHLRGARVLGPLDLESAELKRHVVLEDCAFDAPVALDRATALRIRFEHCDMAGFTAEKLRATSLELTSSRFLPPPQGGRRGVRLSGARFADQLSVSEAELRDVDEGGVALVADGVRVDGHLSLECVRASGAVWLSGAEIKGDLECSGAGFLGCDKYRSALMADDVRVGGRLVLREARSAIGSVRLMQASIAGELDGVAARFLGADADRDALVAPGIRVDGYVSLRGMKAGGALILSGAEIKGQVNLSFVDSLRANTDGCAVEADGLTVRGGMFLREFTARGAVRLLGSDIALQLDFSRARFTGTNGDGEVVIADGMKVGGKALFRYLRAGGAVRLGGTDIKGGVSFGRAVIAPATPHGEALNADRAVMRGDLSLHSLIAEGPVSLRSATVAGRLDCSYAQLTGVDRHHNALIADGIQVGGHLCLGDRNETTGHIKPLRVRGTVRLVGARINGALRIVTLEMAARHTALDATGARITDELHWLPVSQVRGKVILERASAHRVEDNWDDVCRPRAWWPGEGGLQMAGFTYDGFGGRNRAEYEQRLSWIRCGHIERTKSSPGVFAAQPYEQLARVYKQMGQDTEARQISVARRRDKRKHGKLLRPRRLGSWILDRTIAYGFKTGRMGFLLVAIWAVVFGASCWAQQQDDLVMPIRSVASAKAAPAPLPSPPPPPPTMTRPPMIQPPLIQPAPAQPTPTADHPQKGYPAFAPAAYAVDVAIPVLNLHQAEYWGPNTAAPHGREFAYLTYFCTVAGWLTATMAVVGLTGLARRD